MDHKWEEIAKQTSKEVPIGTQVLEDKSLKTGVEKVNGIISRITAIEVIPILYNRNKIIDFYIGNI